jgi:hypothetical protein
LSTNPTHVLSCTWAPPQRLAPSRVASFLLQADPAFESKLLASLRDPSAYPNEKAPFSPLGFWPSVRSTKPRRPKVPSSGFGYPLDGVSLFALGSLFQLPTLLGLTLQGFFPIPGRVPKFPKKPSAPALLHQTVRPDTGASAAFASRTQWFPLALSLIFQVRVGPWPS